MRIVFMGTPEFAVPSLNQLIQDGHNIVGVYTQPDKPKNRGMKLTPPPVKVVAQANHLPVFQPKTLKDEAVQQELAALATADLRRQAVVNPADYARMTGAREGALPAVDTLGGTIRLTEYRPNYLKYEYTSAAPATAVFSEIFYDKGWTAWVDGVETPYFRADYLLRALELPAGDHTVEWRFRAPHWGAVEGVTGLCSAAILLLIAGLAAAEWYKRKKR